MRVVALFRVSTEQQEQRGSSLASQGRRYAELCAERGWEKPCEPFCGQESAAAARHERAVFQQLIAFIRSEPVDALWVIEQSRLTRADQLEVALLVRELQERRIVVIVDTEVRDLSDPSHEMFFGIQGSVDRFELRRTRERLIRGRRERARQGRKTGGRSPYGYRNPIPGDPQRGTLQPVDDEADVVRRIFRDVGAGVSIQALARALTAAGIQAPRGGAWGKTTIARILGNPVYLGVQFFGAWRVAPRTGTVHFDPAHPDAIVVPGAHEPLVTREQFDAARAQVRGTSNGRPALLTGLLWVNGVRAWVDGGHGESFYCPADGSRGAWLPVEPLNALAWEAFGSLFREPETIRALFRGARRLELEQALAGELAAIERRRERLAARLERLVEMRADGEITKAMFAERSEATRRAVREAELAAAAARARLEAASSGHYERTLFALRTLLEPGLLSVEQKRRALRQLLESIHVEAEAASPARAAGGRFAAAAGPKWSARDIFFRLRVPAAAEPSGIPDRRRSGAQRGADRDDSGNGGLLVQVVADGRVLRQPELAPARRRAVGGSRTS